MSRVLWPTVPLIALAVAVAAWAWESVVQSATACTTGRYSAATFLGWAVLVLAGALLSAWLTRRAGVGALGMGGGAAVCAFLSAVLVFFAHAVWMLGHAACTS